MEPKDDLHEEPSARLTESTRAPTPSVRILRDMSTHYRLQVTGWAINSPVSKSENDHLTLGKLQR